jgi:ATP-binding cassette subfamily F protein 3
MHLVQLHHLTLHHAGREIFRDLNWAIGERERIGLVGPNGAGKSSLIRAIVGELIPTQGTITAMRGASMGYLPQEVKLPAGTLFEAACQPSPELADALAQAAAIETRMAEPAVYNDPDALQAVLEAHDLALARCERLDADRQVSSVRELLSRLGFTADEYEMPVEALSGGQTKLVALARLAAWSPDVLLLDEPDNHLDLPAKAALEAFLKHYRGAVVLVSHDRYLLDAVVTHIAELENGKLNAYAGDYSAYTVERDLRRMRQQQQYQNQQRELARIEAMIRDWELKAKADLNERHARQAASRRKMLARMEASGDLVEAVHERPLLALEIAGGRGSTNALALKNVTMGFGDDLLFVGIDLLIRHSERVGLIGRNGAGKSVLFKLILGELQPIDGVIRIGPSTRIGYYAQRHETLAGWARRTPIELVRDSQPMSEGAAVNHLLRFAFTYAQTRQPIATFSGGERSRLQLLALVLKQPNLLLLDEPTNNLDIASSDVLESALEDFEGAILTISHDRYFLDRLVDRIVELDDGGLEEYTGGYGDYVRQKQARREAAEAARQAQAARHKKRGQRRA